MTAARQPGGGTPRRYSRRAFVAGGASVGVALGVAGVAGFEATRGSAESAPGIGGRVAFEGAHQAGVITPPQHYLQAAAFDVTSDKREDLVALLQAWTDAARRMTEGAPAGVLDGDLLAPPVDTGEALDLDAAQLTLTFGFGPSLFARDAVDRFGLAHARPEALVDLPVFPKDALQPGDTGGDLWVQACANDPQVVFHAVRNLARIGRGTVVTRWSQSGFGQVAGTTPDGTPRNLMGFKDGTNNLAFSDSPETATQVWVGDEGPGWMRGGSYVVSRRIRMLIEVWDRSSLADQEMTFGRHKVSGAAFGNTGEFEPVDLEAPGADGAPRIAADAHIRLAAPASNDGHAMLRRGYSYVGAVDPYGQLDAGLFFIAYQRDPRQQFIPVQSRLAALDALNEYIKHTGSGIFAVPPGVREGGWVGQALFET